MKKITIILSTIVVTFSLMAFGIFNMNQNEKDQRPTPKSKIVVVDNDLFKFVFIKKDFDLFYNVDSRFYARVTKEQLFTAKSIIDILPENATRDIQTYQNVRVSILDKDNPTVEILSVKGKNDLLNWAQVQLLKSTDYSTSIYIKAETKIKDALLSGYLNNNLFAFKVRLKTAFELVSSFSADLFYFQLLKL